MYYENISIQSGTTVTTERGFYKNEKTGCLIQILHTLVGIFPGDKIKGNELCKGHFGYTSVGKIVVAGKECDLLEGRHVLLSPVFSKYIIWNASVSQKHYRIHPIPTNVDCVEALFIPSLCVAFQLLNLIIESDKKSKKIFIFGYSLMTEILYRLLIGNGIDAVIIDDSGAGTYRNYIYDDYYLSSIKPSQIGLAVIFNQECTQSPWLSGKRNEIVFKQLETPVFSAASFMQNIHYDLFIEVIDYLRSNNSFLHELVVQHVHAESISQTCKAIEQFRYYGSCIVYDW